MTPGVLDCESIDSAVASVCEVFSCQAAELFEVLDGIDLDAIYEGPNRPVVDVPDFLFAEVSDALGEPQLPSQICWFHFTRTAPGNRFARGILPLGEVLETVWQSLIDQAPSVVEQDNLRCLMRDGVSDFQFGLKAPDPLHWGPYGYLVPAVADCPSELSQHDYRGMPEIIEDICNGYERRFGTALIEHYRSRLLPCTVKFITPAADRGIDVLGIALAYVYSMRKGESPSCSWITCFDGNNEAVPPEAVISVIFHPVAAL